MTTLFLCPDKASSEYSDLWDASAFHNLDKANECFRKEKRMKHKYEWYFDEEQFKESQTASSNTPKINNLCWLFSFSWLTREHSFDIIKISNSCSLEDLAYVRTERCHNFIQQPVIQ